jgi:starvation-inducible DNA-binding protein
MFSTRIDIPQKQRTTLIELLNNRLADAIDLKLQAKQAHWNVKGPSFIALHELFDDVASDLDEHADTIAERITALGGEAEGTLAAVAKRTSIKAYPLHLKTGKEHVEALSDALAALGKNIRQAIAHADEFGDADTVDLFTQISRELDKKLWFVEAHLQADK